MKTCPYCAEEIKDEAIKCRWCGSDLTVAPERAIGPSIPAGGEEETEGERKERRPPPLILPGPGGDVLPPVAPAPSEPIPGEGPQVPGAGPTPPHAAPAPGPQPPVAPLAEGPVPPGGPPRRPRLRPRRLGVRRIALTAAVVAVAAGGWTVAILEERRPALVGPEARVDGSPSPGETAVTPTPATAQPAPQARVYIYHLDLWIQGQVLHIHPRALGLDNHNGLLDLKWTGWGEASAVARGVFHYNDCVPNCAEGTSHEYAVEIRATDLRRCAIKVYPEGGPGFRRVWVYNNVTVRYLDPGADHPPPPGFIPPCQSAEA